MPQRELDKLDDDCLHLEVFPEGSVSLQRRETVFETNEEVLLLRMKTRQKMNQIKVKYEEKKQLQEQNIEQMKMKLIFATNKPDPIMNGLPCHDPLPISLEPYPKMVQMVNERLKLLRTKPQSRPTSSNNSRPSSSNNSRPCSSRYRPCCSRNSMSRPSSSRSSSSRPSSSRLLSTQQQAGKRREELRNERIKKDLKRKLQRQEEIRKKLEERDKERKRIAKEKKNEIIHEEEERVAPPSLINRHTGNSAINRHTGNSAINKTILLTTDNSFIRKGLYDNYNLCTLTTIGSLCHLSSLSLHSLFLPPPSPLSLSPSLFPSSLHPSFSSLSLSLYRYYCWTEY